VSVNGLNHGTAGEVTNISGANKSYW